MSIKAGDVTDTASLTQAFQGCSAVISAASGRGYWSADPVDHKVRPARGFASQYWPMYRTQRGSVQQQGSDSATVLGAESEPVQHVSSQCVSEGIMWLVRAPQGVANTASAAKAAGVGQVVLVSSQLVTRQNLFHPVRLILNNIRWGLMDAKIAGS